MNNFILFLNDLDKISQFKEADILFNGFIRIAARGEFDESFIRDTSKSMLSGGIGGAFMGGPVGSLVGGIGGGLWNLGTTLYQRYFENLENYILGSAETIKNDLLTVSNKIPQEIENSNMYKQYIQQYANSIPKEYESILKTGKTMLGTAQELGSGLLASLPAFKFFPTSGLTANIAGLATGLITDFTFDYIYNQVSDISSFINEAINFSDGINKKVSESEHPYKQQLLEYTNSLIATLKEDREFLQNTLSSNSKEQTLQNNSETILA